MATFLQFLQGHPKPTFSKKVQKGDQEKFLKNHPKSSPRLKGPKALWRKCHYPLNCSNNAKTQEDFGAKSSSKTARMAKLWQFSQGHPKPAFSKKGQRGDQGKFFKNRLKSSPRLKGPKALWRKRHYPLISMYLNCKDSKRFRRKQRLQNCQSSEVMAIFAGSPKKSISWKSARGGPRAIFQKSPKK